MPVDSSVDKPFGDIAVCLSGGGYRAATYALKTLSMLDELDLLDNVRLLSTVSVRTFTGLTYATCQSPLAAIHGKLAAKVENPATHDHYQNGFNVDGSCIPLF